MNNDDPQAAPAPSIPTTDDMELTCLFREINVKLEVPAPTELNPKATKIRRFKMRELNGALRDVHLTAQQKKNETTPDGYIKTTDFTGSCSALLSKMMFEIHTVDGLDVVDKAPIPEAEVQTWPSHVQWQLHKKAATISGLNPEAMEDAKNV